MAHPILPLHLSQHPIYCLVKAAPPPCPDQLDYASYTSVLTHIPVSLLWQSKSRQVQQILVNVTSSTPPPWRSLCKVYCRATSLLSCSQL
jgi:hypothetical protein